MEEQGFQNEFDEIDEEAVHILLFDAKGIPVATCRIFQENGKEEFILGRLAVIKEYRGKNLGSEVIRRAEDYLKHIQGKKLVLHAQCRVVDFYKKLGFTEYGEIDEEEGCPHIWMEKEIKG